MSRHPVSRAACGGLFWQRLVTLGPVGTDNACDRHDPVVGVNVHQLAPRTRCAARVNASLLQGLRSSPVRWYIPGLAPS